MDGIATDIFYINFCLMSNRSVQFYSGAALYTNVSVLFLAIDISEMLTI